jgi:hypothetical protein
MIYPTAVEPTPLLLEAHFAAWEAALRTLAAIPGNAGHPDHLGAPREAFIYQFLEEHLSESMSIGTGEIIDYSSKPGDFSQKTPERRNQCDIVIFGKTFPKIHFGGGVHGFLVESVVAMLEVKSTLTKEKLKLAIKAARDSKAKKRQSMAGTTSGMHYQVQAIVNFVVAYAAEIDDMAKVYQWIVEIYTELGIPNTPLPPLINDQILGAAEPRFQTASPALDGVFVLGKGFVLFDNWPLSFINSEMRTNAPEHNWAVCDSVNGSGTLYWLFVCLTMAAQGAKQGGINWLTYTETLKFQSRLGK